MRKLPPLLAAIVSLALLALARPASAEGSPAYIALGDSLAFGVGASDPAADGYVGVTYDALRRSERFRDHGLDLVNLSVPGATTYDLLLPGGQLEMALDEIDQRDVEIITVDIGRNDALALASSDSPCVADPLAADCQDGLQQMLAALEGNLTDVLGRLREAAPDASIVLADLYSPLSGRGGASDLITDLAIREINTITERVVSTPELRVDRAGVYSLFLGRASQLVATDGVHANNDGHSLIAQVVLAAIEDRDPTLPDDLMTPVAVEGIGGPSLGVGGLQPVAEEEDEDSNLALLLAIAIPASLLGMAAAVGAYRAARGR